MYRQFISTTVLFIYFSVDATAFLEQSIKPKLNLH